MSAPDLTETQRRAFPTRIQAVLEDIAPLGRVRLWTVGFDAPAPTVLRYDFACVGLDPSTMARLAERTSGLRSLRVLAPNDRGAACSQWFGNAHGCVIHLTEPLQAASDPGVAVCDLRVAMSADDDALLTWAIDEREVIAEKCVERLLSPLLSQSVAIGFEAVATGVVRASRTLPARQAAGLLGALGRLAQSSSVAQWASDLALRAPALRQLYSEIRHSVAQDSAPSHTVTRVRLENLDGLSVSISPDDTYQYLKMRSLELNALREVTGAALPDYGAAVAFVTEVMDLCLAQYRVNGCARLALPRGVDAPSSSSGPASPPLAP